MGVNNIIEQVNLDQLQYQVTMLKLQGVGAPETKEARLMRIKIARKYLTLLEMGIKKEAY